jgi:integrase/recombinase XerD
MNSLTLTQNIVSLPDDSIDEFCNAVMAMVAPTSQRVYRQTYDTWKQWCLDNEHSPLDFKHVLNFLAARSDTLATRQRKLSAMRKLVEIANIITRGEFEVAYQLLKRAKAPKVNLNKKERAKIALNPSQVQRIFDTWYGDSNQSKRNCALMAILFIGGLRRSEAAVLQWQNVDLANGVIHVIDGKGGKDGDVGLSGKFVIKALKEWKKRCEDRLYVFPRISKNDALGKDEPITGDAIYAITKATVKMADLPKDMVDHIAPHTARRTLITESLETGMSLADTKAQARHANEATTLRYARPGEASERGKKSRLRYGD